MDGWDGIWYGWMGLVCWRCSSFYRSVCDLSLRLVFGMRPWYLEFGHDDASQIGWISPGW